MQDTLRAFPSTRSTASALHVALALVAALAAAGCAGDDDAAEEFAERARGAWRLERVQDSSVGPAYIVQTITLTDRRESLLMQAFADPGKTIPLLAYESSGPYEVVGESATISDAFELELQNETSMLTAYVVDPAFLNAIGLDDCGLAAGQPTDISNGCGAPIFSVTDCIDLDLFQVARGGTELRTGAPGVDRCVERPAALEPVPYLRVAL